MPHPGSRHVIAGCGYTGRKLAERLLDGGAEVIALTKTSSCGVSGAETVRLDLDDPPNDVQVDVKDANVLYFVPPSPGSMEDVRLLTFLEHVITGVPKHFVLCSTTGVYGNCAGQWVDENAPLAPTTDKSRRRVASERACAKWADLHGVDLAILRVAAIYGPGRVPVKTAADKIKLPPSTRSGYTNRIHVDDLVSVFMAASERQATGAFNVADGSPMRMNEYFRLVAEIWGLPKPRGSQIEDAGRSGIRDSRKIDVARMRNELHGALRHPDLRAALERIRASERSA